MDVVADTNVLFSFFNERSSVREISLSGVVLLYSPSFALAELERHKDDIMKRFSLDESRFNVAFGLLKSTVEFVPEEAYADAIPRAKDTSPDPDDVDFFALAIKLGLPLWSNDRKLKAQSDVRVFSTKELVALLPEFEL